MHMKHAGLYFFFLITCFLMQGRTLYGQSISNEGMEFWAIFPTHDPSGGNMATMNINVTSKSESEVTVSCGSWQQTQIIPANTVVTFLVDRPQSYIDYNDGNQPLTNRAIHIKVTPGRSKVVAYAHMFAAARSAATLILPVESLGQKYYSMNYTQDNSSVSQNYMVFVAAEDDTRLLLYKKGNEKPDVIDLPHAGDVYEYISTSKEDLTGTYVEVDPSTSPCKRFAAFAGSTSIIIGGCAGSRDPLFQQLYSVNSWGKSYGLVPFKDRRYVFRVLAQEDGTTVRMNGNLLAVLNRGQYYESNVLTDGVFLNADKLISVAQYAFTQACSSAIGRETIGDPEMVLLNPVEFNIKNITVFSSSRENIIEKYVNIFMKTARTSTFRLNGSQAGINWTPMPSDPLYSYAQIQVFDTNLTLTADEGFNAIAYGFGNFESYAYSAGTNLYSTSTLGLLNVQTKLVSTTSACLGQATKPKLTVPYRLTRITWDFHDGSGLYTDDNPAKPEESTNNMGVKIYTYTSPIEKTFIQTGSRIITAMAVLSPDDTPPCFDGNDIEFNFEIDVVPLGKADFDIPEICAGHPTQFTDKSSISGSTIAEWRWDIDGVIYTEQNPLHTFTNKGMHTVKLSVANVSGCWSDVLSRTFSVNRDFPQLEFVKKELACITDPPFQFVVNEKLGLPAAKKEFSGKGVSASGVFDPATAGAGLHTITYTFTSVDGCTDVVTTDIEVYALTEIEAEPTVYILAGGQKKIEASIKNPNPSYPYIYKWTPAAGLSRDDVLAPVASPEKDTWYTLTVSLEGLCSVEKKVFVKVLDEVKPPNSFSPNGDGVNDVWNIEALTSYPNATIEVFNRNGQKVFFSKGYLRPFDGNFQNKPLPVGVYYYRINPNNGRRMLSGALTLIR